MQVDEQTTNRLLKECKEVSNEDGFELADMIAAAVICMWAGHRLIHPDSPTPRERFEKIMGRMDL